MKSILIYIIICSINKLFFHLLFLSIGDVIGIVIGFFLALVLLAVIGVLVYIFRHNCGKEQHHDKQELRELSVDHQLPAQEAETQTEIPDNQGLKKIENFSHMEKELEKTAGTFSHNKRQELEPGSKTEIRRSRQESDV